MLGIDGEAILRAWRMTDEAHETLKKLLAQLEELHSQSASWRIDGISPQLGKTLGDLQMLRRRAARLTAALEFVAETGIQTEERVLDCWECGPRTGTLLPPAQTELNSMQEILLTWARQGR